MAKDKCSWELIRSFLIEELKSKESIMTFGTIGSTNIEHDIDVIITKKPKSSSALFFKEVHIIYDNLDKYLQSNFGLVAKRFSRLSEEPLISALGQKKKGIFFHTMVYVSYPQIEKDWAWGIFPGDDMKKILNENYSLLKGDINDLFSKEFGKPNFCDNVFTYLYLNDLIHSTYPDKAVIETMNHVLYYLFIKRLNSKFTPAKNLIELRERVYSLCELADKVNFNGKIDN